MDIGSLITLAAVALAIDGAWSYYSLRSSEPLRLELAHEGESLLADPKLNDEDRVEVQFILDHVFSRWLIRLCAVAFPLLALWMAIDKHARAELWKSRRTSEYAGRIARLHELSFEAICALTPVIGTIATFERRLIHMTFALFHKPEWLVDALMSKKVIRTYRLIGRLFPFVHIAR